MIRPRAALFVLLLAGLLAGCVRFQPAVLYTGTEPAPVPERPRALALAVEPVIFADDATNLWFMEDANCVQGGVTEAVAAEGRRAIEVTWNRGAPGCEWAGLGVGWDDWLGKDLSEVLPYAAVQMRVRAQEGRLYGLPIVLTLEDYAGGMGFAYTDNKYFERPFIDEDWQTVTVPLADFDLAVEDLDPTNVKQLMLELQQSGAIYLDDLRLVFYEEEEQAPWLVEAPRPDPTALPIQLFGDQFINDDGWGLVADGCQAVETTREDAAEGQAALRLRWDVRPEGCYSGTLGVSWNRWYPVDLTPVADEAAIRFAIRTADGQAARLPVRVGLQDYAQRSGTVVLGPAYAPPGGFSTEWTTVTIPVAALRDEVDLSNVKQLVVYLDDAGAVYLDDLRLVAAR